MVLTEPEAAVKAYKYKADIARQKRKLYLVYTLGEYCLRAAIVEVLKREIYVKTSSEIRHLSGQDIDNELV